MKYQAYALRDVVADAFHFPFYASNDPHARRIAERMVQQPEHAEYIDDFQLWHVGEFDNQTGAFTPSKLTNIGGLSGPENPQQSFGDVTSVQSRSKRGNSAESV